MKTKWTRSYTYLALFVTLCLLTAFGLVAVFGDFRFTKQSTYKAEFTDVSGLQVRDFVRVGGVEVGQVQKISITKDLVAVVEFTADESVPLTQGSKAAIRWANPIGARYMSLLEGPGEPKRLTPGATIPVARTEPALDLDVLLGGFRPLFRALDPEQVNTLSSALIEAFQGEGASIGSFLSQAALVTNTLADRDELIGQVINNLDVVLGSFGGQSKQFAKAVDSLSQLVQGLEARKTDISNAVAYTNASSQAIADLLVRTREPLKQTVTQSDRAATIVLNDHEYFDDWLNTIPDAYKTLTGLATKGDFLGEYLCSMTLKLNGKNGQPSYVVLTNQVTGRCEPK